MSISKHSFSLPNLTYSYAEELKGFYQFVQGEPISSPHLIISSADTANLLGIPPLEQHSDDVAKLFSFNTPPPLTTFSQSLAQKYGGHQFGQYNPELGDGRGLLVGEIEHNGTKWDLHIKGAGRTPYSRFGDGRAVLRSSIREFLASEALAALGIPTSRALCLIGSNEPVQRETLEKAAMLTRVCQTHIRFGHFENYFYLQQHDKLKQLLDYTIKHHFPECYTSPTPYKAFLKTVVISTAHLIAKWQAFGFAHGVMNTDNMSILGITFDFGPYGFLDAYDPNYICNHSDHTGRYAFNQQPNVGLWNLNALSHALSPFINADDLKLILSMYRPELSKHYLNIMRQKLGLTHWLNSDHALLDELMAILEKEKMDYTLFFRKLSHLDLQNAPQPFSKITDDFIDRAQMQAWLTRYTERLENQTLSHSERQSLMLSNNPKYILRNYLAQNAIKAAEHGDYQPLHELHDALTKPFDEQPQYEKLAARPPEWSKSISISCSS